MVHGYQSWQEIFCIYTLSLNFYVRVCYSYGVLFIDLWELVKVYAAGTDNSNELKKT